jgi:hypothetical protein
MLDPQVVVNLLPKLGVGVDLLRHVGFHNFSGSFWGFIDVLRDLGGEVLKNLPKIGKFFTLVRHLDQE